LYVFLTCVFNEEPIGKTPFRVRGTHLIYSIPL
jgi:hypothetical protein